MSPEGTSTETARVVVRVAPALPAARAPAVPPIAKLPDLAPATPASLRALVLLDGTAAGELAPDRPCVLDLGAGTHRLVVRAVIAGEASSAVADATTIVVTHGARAHHGRQRVASAARVIRDALRREPRISIEVGAAVELACWYVFEPAEPGGPPTLALELSASASSAR